VAPSTAPSAPPAPSGSSAGAPAPSHHAASSSGGDGGGGDGGGDPIAAATRAAAASQSAGEVVVRVRIPQGQRARALLPPSVSVVNTAQDNAEAATIRIGESSRGTPTV
jgi:hypothetical protein